MFALGGCLKLDKKRGNVARKDILAIVGGRVITINDFKQAMRYQTPYFRSRYIPLSHKKVFLRQLVRFELLKLEAKRRKLDTHPVVKQTVTESMIKLLLRRVVQRLKTFQVSEKEMRMHYKKHLQRYHKPERRHVRQIVIRVPDGSTRPFWSTKRQLAYQIFEQVQQHGKTRKGFVRMVNKYSEDQYSRKRGGDIGADKRSELGGKWERTFSDAVFQMKKVGDITGPILTSWGFHIIRLERILPPVNKTFADVKAELREELVKRKQKVLYDDLMAKLYKKHPVKMAKGWKEKLQVFRKAYEKAKSDAPAKRSAVKKRVVVKRSAPKKKPTTRRTQPAHKTSRPAPQRKVSPTTRPATSRPASGPASRPL
tara:strand:+ start:21180 stop:22286 length:1107 start_codon:yes stop_codon:yes gene_type:complete